MKPYYETELGKLYHGDCLEILPQIEEKVDLVLTDPPYGMGDKMQGGSWGATTKDKMNWDRDTSQEEKGGVIWI
jgi:DNA modification methylase